MVVEKKLKTDSDFIQSRIAMCVQFFDLHDPKQIWERVEQLCAEAPLKPVPISRNIFNANLGAMVRKKIFFRDEKGHYYYTPQLQKAVEREALNSQQRSTQKPKGFGHIAPTSSSQKKQRSSSSKSKSRELVQPKRLEDIYPMRHDDFNPITNLIWVIIPPEDVMEQFQLPPGFFIFWSTEYKEAKAYENNYPECMLLPLVRVKGDREDRWRRATLNDPELMEA